MAEKKPLVLNNGEFEQLQSGDTLPIVSHASTHTNGTDDIQSATSAQKGLMTSTYASKLDGLSASAQIPAGGATGQVLSKKSGTDYDTQWVDAPSGGGGSGVGDKLYLYNRVSGAF